MASYVHWHFITHTPSRNLHAWLAQNRIRKSSRNQDMWLCVGMSNLYKYKCKFYVYVGENSESQSFSDANSSLPQFDLYIKFFTVNTIIFFLCLNLDSFNSLELLSNRKYSHKRNPQLSSTCNVLKSQSTIESVIERVWNYLWLVA